MIAGSDKADRRTPKQKSTMLPEQTQSGNSSTFPTGLFFHRQDQLGLEIWLGDMGCRFVISFVAIF